MFGTPNVPEKVADRRDILPFAIFLVLFLLMFREFFFTDRTLFDRDVTLWEVPARKLCAQLLKEGNWALWTDAYGGGQPFLANLKNAVLYPWNLLYLLLPFFAAFKLYYLFHVLVTWLGVYFLGRSYALSRRASFLAASVFGFGGMYLSSFEFYSHVAGLAWLPWILFLLRRPVRSRPARTAALAALGALSILAGAPEITLITLVLAALQILFLAGERGKTAVMAAAALGLALLIAAAQLVPSFELWRQSGRSATRYGEWSLEAVQLLDIPFPGILGNDRQSGQDHYWGGHFFDRGYPLYYSLFVGMGALILAASALGASRDRRTLFLGLSALLFLVLASGRYSPLSRLLTSLPLISSLRYPVKFLVGSVFPISLLAGLGFDRVFGGVGKGEAPYRWTAPAALAVSAGLLATLSGRAAGALATAFGVTRASETAAIQASLLSAAALAGLLALVLAASRVLESRRRAVSFLAIGLIILDLAYHNRHINPVVPTSFFAATQLPASAPRPFRLYRENDVPATLRRGSTEIRRLARYAHESAFPLTGIGDGLFYLFDEDTLDIYPPAYRQLSQAVAVADREARLKILRTEGCDVYVSHARLPGLPADRVNTSEGPVFLHRLAESPNGVRIVHDSVEAATPEDRMRACLGAGFDPERTVIVEHRPPRRAEEAGAGNDSVEVTDSRQGRIRCRVALSSDGIIVSPDNFARGWRASIDGRPAEVLAANLSSKGVFVPAGTHQVEIFYAPSTFGIGTLVSGLALLGLAALFAAPAILRSPAARRRCPAAGVFL